MRPPLIATAAVAAVILAAIGVAALRRPPPQREATAQAAAEPAPAFTLATTPALARGLPGSHATAADGTVAVSAADLHGRVALLYFGYTTCPDVCPTELAWMARVLRSLGPAATEVVPVFVTIDPERDTLPRLQDYAALFDPRIVALRGDAAQTAAAAAACGIAYQRNVPAGAAPGFYLMDHSLSTVVLGRDGRIAMRLSSRDLSSAQAAERLRPLLGAAP